MKWFRLGVTKLSIYYDWQIPMLSKIDSFMTECGQCSCCVYASLKKKIINRLSRNECQCQSMNQQVNKVIVQIHYHVSIASLRHLCGFFRVSTLTMVSVLYKAKLVNGLQWVRFSFNVHWLLSQTLTPEANKNCKCKNRYENTNR